MNKLELKKRLEELAGEVDDLADEVEHEIDTEDAVDAETEAEDIASERDHLLAENEILKQRVAILEAELAERGPQQPQFVSSTPLTPFHVCADRGKPALGTPESAADHAEANQGRSKALF